ncbi:RNI-like superfamily protein [Tanacetum coccineum]
MGDGLAAIGLGLASNLKILFYECRFIKDDAIIEISKRCPLLQEWNLSVCVQIGIRGWESIGMYCINLETLHREDVEIKRGHVKPKLPSWAFKRYTSSVPY